jgi:hypothetical protein
MGLKELCTIVSQNSNVSKDLGFSRSQKYKISDNVLNIVTSSQWVKTSVGVAEP